MCWYEEKRKKYEFWDLIDCRREARCVYTGISFISLDYLNWMLFELANLNNFVFVLSSKSMDDDFVGLSQRVVIAALHILNEPIRTSSESEEER